MQKIFDQELKEKVSILNTQSQTINSLKSKIQGKDLEIQNLIQKNSQLVTDTQGLEGKNLG